VGAVLYLEGAKLDHLRAEVKFLSDDEIGFGGELPRPLQTELWTTWEELRRLSEQLDEPRLPSEQFVQHHVSKSTTWVLADLWQKLRIQVETYRQQAPLVAAIQEWVAGEQQSGRLPQQLPRDLDINELGMPESLVDAVWRVRRKEGFEPKAKFWEPFLEVLTTEDSVDRAALLVRMAQEELKNTRARASLQQLFG